MTKGQTEAGEARDRCLGRMVSEQDLETRRSLWRAALRYHERVRGERATGVALPPLAAVGAGGC